MLKLAIKRLANLIVEPDELPGCSIPRRLFNYNT